MVIKLKRTVMVVVMAALMLAGFQMITCQEAEAAAAPKPVKKMNIDGITASKAIIKWNKVKGVSGYVLFKNGKAYKRFGSGTRSYKDTALKIGGKYRYSVKTFKNARVKEWYNKETKKWQRTKPRKKIRGSSRYIKTKLYSKAGPTCRFTVKDYKKVYYGRTVKASQCPVRFVVKGTECKICGKGGKVVTVTFNKSNNGFRRVEAGMDYSDPNNCHHCIKSDLYGKCGNARYYQSGGKKGQLYSNKKGLMNDHELTAHSHNFPGKSMAELAQMALGELEKKYPNVKWKGGKTFHYVDDGTTYLLTEDVINKLKYGGKSIYCGKMPVHMDPRTPAWYCHICGGDIAK